MRKLKLFMGIVALIMVALLFTGCGEFVPAEGSSVVIIMGRHANANLLSKSDLDKHLSDVINSCVSTYQDGSSYVAEADISVIISDGMSSSVPITYKGLDFPLTVRKDNFKNVTGFGKSLSNVVTTFLTDETLKADDDEVDLVFAIQEAANILDHSDRKTKHIVVVDTGIVTKGVMDMNAYSIQDHTADEVMNHIGEGAFPNLEGVTVSWYGMGNVCGEQIDLRDDTVFKTTLVNLWTAYFNKCGATISEEFKYSERTGTAQLAPAYLEVTPVGFVETVPPTETEKTEPTTVTEEKKEILNLSTEELHFKRDSSEFENKEAAIETLHKYDDFFYKMVEEGRTLYVIGAIARTKADFNKQPGPNDLSRERAEEVRKLLIEEFGFKKKNIVVIDGNIFEGFWRTGKEFNDDGTPVENFEEEQAKNRLVCIVPDSSTDYVKKLVEYGMIKDPNK